MERALTKSELRALIKTSVIEVLSDTANRIMEAFTTRASALESEAEHIRTVSVAQRRCGMASSTRPGIVIPPEEAEREAEREAAERSAAEEAAAREAARGNQGRSVVWAIVAVFGLLVLAAVMFALWNSSMSGRVTGIEKSLSDVGTVTRDSDGNITNRTGLFKEVADIRTDMNNGFKEMKDTIGGSRIVINKMGEEELVRTGLAGGYARLSDLVENPKIGAVATLDKISKRLEADDIKAAKAQEAAVARKTLPPRALEDLASSDKDIAEAAMTAIIAMGPDAVPALIDALQKDSRPEVKRRIEACLVQIGQPAVDSLVGLFGADEPTAGIAYDAVERIGKQSGPSAVLPALAKGASSTDRRVAVRAKRLYNQFAPSTKLPLASTSYTPTVTGYTPRVTGYAPTIHEVPPPAPAPVVEAPRPF
jgi:hypothetical protein